MRVAASLIAVIACSVTVWAQDPTSTAIAERARRSKAIVVGTVSQVDSMFATSEFGDQLIVTRVTLAIEETLKGTPDATVTMTVEGGTVGGLTLKVSDMPALTIGDRAMVFLSGAFNTYTPTDRGQGILALDAANEVRGIRLPLADLRRMVRAAR